MVADELERLGIDLDLLVNNAAVGYSGKFFSRPIEEELVPVTVNVHSLVALTHLLGRKMMARGAGGIIKDDKVHYAVASKSGDDPKRSSGITFWFMPHCFDPFPKFEDMSADTW
jgi:NADP-dependent 3-hydroxy acid dehydrogenase YdfG